MSNVVYTITNLINNKIYVGSSVDFIKRKSRHFNDLLKNIHPNKFLQNSWNKYGKDNFKIEILEEYESSDVLIYMEKYWINLLNSKSKKFGYNLMDPITNSLGRKHTQETKDKMSAIHKGIARTKGRKLSLDHKRKIKESLAKYKLNFGLRKWSRTIIQYDKDMKFIKEWRSAQEASKELNIVNSTICRCLNNERGTAGGFMWRLKKEEEVCYF